MSLKVMVDANVYLRFYEQKSSGFKKLLESIAELKTHVFVTQQIVDEVLRNKLEIAIRSIKGVSQSFKIKEATFPEGFKDKSILAWNEAIRELRGKEEELDKLADKLIMAVAQSDDTVSVTLQKLFEGAQVPSETQISRADLRKKLGNPPGKKTDPIGDQLTWEQLLDSVSSSDQVFIVSYDQDFFEKNGDKLFLNPYLVRDLKAKGVSESNIFVFDKLVDALKEIKKTVELSGGFPAEKEIRGIKNEESVPYGPLYEDLFANQGLGTSGFPAAYAPGGLTGTSFPTSAFPVHGSPWVTGSSSDPFNRDLGIGFTRLEDSSFDSPDSSFPSGDPV